MTRWLRTCATIFMLTANVPAFSASTTANPAPDDLGRWGLHCFCIDAVSTPHRPVRYDSNGQLLLRAMAGASIAGLRAEGLPIADSQIALLRAYGLVKVDGDRISTAFPVLGPAVAAEMRRHSALLGKQIATEIRPQVRAIREELARRGLSASTYAIVFGYALDGLVWDRLRAMKLLPETALTIQQPFWRGAFWAVYPERTGGAGRNEITLRNAKLATVWTDPAADRLNAFLKSPDAQAALAEIEKSPARPALAPNLQRPDKSPAFPVIRVTAGDRLVEPAAAIAATLATALAGDRSRDLRGAVPNATNQDAIVIVAHELIWDIAAALVANGDLEVPPILKGGAAATPLTPALFAIVAN